MQLFHMAKRKKLKDWQKWICYLSEANMLFEWTLLEICCCTQKKKTLFFLGYSCSKGSISYICRGWRLTRMDLNQLLFVCTVVCDFAFSFHLCVFARWFYTSLTLHPSYRDVHILFRMLDFQMMGGGDWI